MKKRVACTCRELRLSAELSNTLEKKGIGKGKELGKGNRKGNRERKGKELGKERV